MKTRNPLLSVLAFALAASLLFIGTHAAFAGWSRLLYGGTLSSVRMLSATKAIAVGWDGVTYRTTDGGVTWTVGDSATAVPLNGLHFVDANTGWQVGGFLSGEIRKTTDGGATWTAQSSGTSNTLTSVYFVDANRGWAVGSNGTIRRTIDSGTTWTGQNSGTTQYLTGVHFADVNTGWAVGFNGTIVATTNGGTTWTAQTSGTTNLLYAVRFANASTGWAVGSSGTILATTDGGLTWTAQTSGTSRGLHGVHFADANTGWAVGDLGTIRKTTNGGATWTAQTSGTQSYLDDVHFIDANNGCASGSSATLLTTSDGGATWTVRQQGFTGIQVLGLSFIDANTGWLCGDGGVVSKTTDGGAHWTSQMPGTSAQLMDIKFVDANTGWVVGSSGTIRKTTNGGANWIGQISNTSQYLECACFVDANRGWVVGWSGTIIATVDGGATWMPQTSGTLANLYGVQFVDANTGWAAGANGTILKTTNGGTTWTAQISGTTGSLIDLSFINANVGWAIGDTVLKTTDGGATWKSLGVGALHGAFIDANVGWIVSGRGSARWTANGGTSWTSDPAPTQGNLFTSILIDANTFYTSSSSGVVLKYTATPEIAVEQPVGTDLTDGASTIDYGSVTLGGSVEKTFTIRSTGTGILNGIDVTVDGANAGDFTVTTNPAMALAAGGSTTVKLRFTPSAASGSTAALHISSNDADESSFDIVLTGTGTTPPTTWSNASDALITASQYNATALTLNPVLGFAPVPGTNLTVARNTGSAFIQGEFTDLPNGATVNLTYDGTTYPFVVWYYGGTSGRDLVLLWPYTGLAAWGGNTGGQLGDNSITPRYRPVPVDRGGVLAGKTIVQIARGAYHTLALTSEGKVYAWGANDSGQLGDNSTTARVSPVAVDVTSGLSALFGKTVTSIAAGTRHSLAVCSDGTVATWGSNITGQLGDNSTTNRLVPVTVNATDGVSVLFGKTVVAVAGGVQHSAALCSDGSLASWGSAGAGQLGDNTFTSRLVPVPVNTASGISALYGKTVIQIAVGAYHTLALCTDGTLVGWGDNGSGQLGDASTSQRRAPVAVNTAGGTSALFGKSVAAVACGSTFSMALCTDGTLAAWGDNTHGQLGDDSTVARNTPVTVNTASGTSALFGKTVTEIGTGAIHSFAVCSDGSAAAWGFNGSGGLGDKTGVGRLVPVAVDTSSGSALAGRSASGLTGSGSAIHSMAIYGTPAPTPPVVISPTMTSITTTAATLGAMVASDGDATITERGLVLCKTSDNADPQLGGNAVIQVTVSGTTGLFTKVVSGLSAHTSYTFKAYATNAQGTSYSAAATFTTLNSAPVAPNGLTTGTTGDSQTVTLSSLVTPTDADGDTLTLTNVTALIGLTCSFDQNDLTFTPDAGFTGNASFTYTVTDGVDTATGAITVAVTDSQAPVISAPANFTVYAADANGAVVTYAPTASDLVDGELAVMCVPQSGSTLPIGTTTVTCSAVDAANNSAIASFAVTVLPPLPKVENGETKNDSLPGAGVPGSAIAADAVFKDFGVPSINDADQVAYLANYGSTLRRGGAKGAAIFAGKPAVMVTGTGAVAPGTDGAIFTRLFDPVLNRGGAAPSAVAFRGRVGKPSSNSPLVITTANDTGVWTNVGGTLELIARGSDVAPGTDGALFKEFRSLTLVGDELLMLCALQKPTSSNPNAPGGVTTANDLGVWRWTASTGLQLIVRKGQMVPTASGDKKIMVFQMLGTISRSAGHGRNHLTAGVYVLRVTCLGSVVVNYLVDARGESPVFMPLAETKQELLPGFTATKVGPSSGNTTGEAAFTASFANAAGMVTSADNSAIVASRGGTWEIVARKGGAAIDSTTWFAFTDPVMNEVGDVAWRGTIAGAAPGTNTVIAWSPAGGVPAVLARIGTAAPETGGGIFTKFTSLAICEGGPLFTATMQSKVPVPDGRPVSPGPGGVTSLDDVGLWGMDSRGELRLLLREGQVYNGRIVREFTVLANVAASPGQTRSFNASREIIARVKFRDLSQSLMTITIP